MFKYKYGRYGYRTISLYIILLPMALVYLLKSTARRKTTENDIIKMKTFSSDVSYLENDPFYRKLILQYRNASSDLVCSNLFTTSKGIPWNEEQYENMLLFQAEILNVIEGEQLQGNSGHFPDQQRLYYQLAQMKFIKTVCETGFNAGHSAFIWLNSNSNLQIYSFDIGEHRYTRPMAQMLKSWFPGRLHIKYGDSRWTLPEFHRLYPNVSCDLMVIDGGHYTNVPRKDLINLRELASDTNLIILDDQPGPEYFTESIADMWTKSVKSGLVQELFVCLNDRRLATLNRKKGLTLARYI